MTVAPPPWSDSSARHGRLNLKHRVARTLTPEKYPPAPRISSHDHPRHERDLRADAPRSLRRRSPTGSAGGTGAICARPRSRSPRSATASPGSLMAAGSRPCSMPPTTSSGRFRPGPAGRRGSSRALRDHRQRPRPSRKGHLGIRRAHRSRLQVPQRRTGDPQPAGLSAESVITQRGRRMVGSGHDKSPSWTVLGLRGDC